MPGKQIRIFKKNGCWFGKFTSPAIEITRKGDSIADAHNKILGEVNNYKKAIKIQKERTRYDIGWDGRISHVEKPSIMYLMNLLNKHPHFGYTHEETFYIR